MTKPTKATTEVSTTPAQPAKAEPRYKVGKAPRLQGHSATKNGKGGTEGTWGAIAAHMSANGGTISESELKKICTEQGDSGFAGYARGKQRQWLIVAE